VATPLVLAIVGAGVVWIGIGSMQWAMQRYVPHRSPEGELVVTRECGAAPSRGGSLPSHGGA